MNLTEAIQTGFARALARQEMHPLISRMTPSQIKSNGCKYRGIVKDAKALGVTYPHLWRVLTGERTSPTLIARYRALHNSPDPDQTTDSIKSRDERRAA